jgi:hypothetical protein
LPVVVAEPDITHLPDRNDIIQRSDQVDERRSAAGPLKKEQADIINAQTTQALVDRGRKAFGGQLLVQPLVVMKTSDLGSPARLLAAAILR